MGSFKDSLQAVIDAGRAARWPEYRLRFAALREGLLPHFALEEHSEVRRHLEMLGAAAPERDPEGCIAALEQLAALLREQLEAETALDALEAPPAVDLRGLQPPEPILRIFQALERAPGEPLRVILPHEPLPLYALLRERGFTCSGSRREDGGYELLIEAS